MKSLPTIHLRRWGAPTAAALLLAACGTDTLRSLRTKTDEFTQNVAAKVDVLWVIDNSSSMGEEQQGLGESFNAFIQNLISSSVDYSIGVVSTDPADDGELHTGASGIPVITSTTPNAAQVFLENVKVGTNGALSERAFESAALALGKGRGWTPGQPASPPNAGFPRDDAALFIIMVSDEDDKSFGPVRYYQRLFESYKGPGNESLISVSAIVSPPGEPPCFQAARGSAAEAGNRYGDLVSQTATIGRNDAVLASICDDFTESLATLSITAAGLKSVFVLSSVPNTNGGIRCDQAGTDFLCVKVDGVAIPKGRSVNDANGWTFDAGRNAVVFGVNKVPRPQQRITVEYQDMTL